MVIDIQGDSPLNDLTDSTRAWTTVALDRSFEASGSGVPLPTPPWTHRLSTSFAAVAEQIAAASQELAQVPTNSPLTSTAVDIGVLSSRLDAIERTQERLSAEFDALKAQFSFLGTSSPRTVELDQKVSQLMDMIKLSQSQLYPRLHNSNVSVAKMAIKPLVMANGKVPENFPATKGEFEHLTKERYDHLLKSYDLPIVGDTAEKRDVMRVFIGLPN